MDREEHPYLVRVFVGQRAKEDAVDDAKDGRVRSEAERERDHCRDREPRRFQELAEGELEIAEHLPGR